MRFEHKTLIHNGWVPFHIFDDELESWYYEKTITVPGHVNYYGQPPPFFLKLRPYSNTNERDWCGHVDNNDHESVAPLNVATFEQIEQLIQLCIN